MTLCVATPGTAPDNHDPKENVTVLKLQSQESSREAEQIELDLVFSAEPFAP